MNKPAAPAPAEKICDHCKEWTPATMEALQITKDNAQRFGIEHIVPACPRCGSRDWATSSKHFRDIPHGTMPTSPAPTKPVMFKG